MENEILKVEGMRCPSCSKLITVSVGDIVGVIAVEADHEAGTVDVVYDPALVSRDQIVACINDLDFVVVA